MTQEAWKLDGSKPYVLRSVEVYGLLAVASLVVGFVISFGGIPIPELKPRIGFLAGWALLNAWGIAAIPGIIFGVWRGTEHAFGTPSNLSVKVTAGVFIVRLLWAASTLAGSR